MNDEIRDMRIRGTTFSPKPGHDGARKDSSSGRLVAPLLCCLLVAAACPSHPDSPCNPVPPTASYYREYCAAGDAGWADAGWIELCPGAPNDFAATNTDQIFYCVDGHDCTGPGAMYKAQQAVPGCNQLCMEPGGPCPGSAPCCSGATCSPGGTCP